ncbi:MAG TPA: FAD-dependent monooxygenase [Candidatus Dormibacteraeota bacterium]
MKIAVVGGGPGGLYLSVLLKDLDPRHQVTVFERNRPDDTFGFGVVFSDNTMGFISAMDQRVYPQLIRQGVRWEPIEVRHGGRVVRCGGIGFSAIERKLLLQLLQQHAAARGVELRFQTEVPALAALGDEFDLVVAADGVNSLLRTELAHHLEPEISEGGTRFTWLGSTHRYPSFTFLFARDQFGEWAVHIYPYREDGSTFIVEADEATWRRAGAESWTETDTIAHAERLFAADLDGGRLLSNRSLWLRFRTVRCRRWFHGNVVLLGDAAHTAHFSVGSGTKMAMEDALALARAITSRGDVADALQAYVSERRPRVEHIQRMAGLSQAWWESFRFNYSWPAPRFAFHLLTRAQMRYDTLRDRDPAFLEAVAADSGVTDLMSRVAAATPPGSGPVAEASEGCAFVFSDLLAVAPEGRIAAADRGLWCDEQVEEWRQALAGARTPVYARLNHAGPRASMRPRAEGIDRPLALERGGWERVTECAPAIRDLFVAAARRALAAGFHGLELFFAHGYLVAAHISPLTHAAPFEERARFPVEVVAAVREVWPRERPLLVAYSATDWAPGGLSAGEAVELARRFRSAGADMIDVLGGQTTARSQPPYAPCYQMFIAGKVRNEAGVPVITAGGVGDLDDVRTILYSGRADMVALDTVRIEAT